MNAQKIERHERILSSLDKLQYATVKQLHRLHDLKSDRNCYRILRQLKDDKLVNFIKREMNIYHLTKEGRELIGSEKELPKSRVMDHILMRNDLFIYLGCPPSWTIEQEVEVGKEVIRSDAYFRKNKEHYFVEVDHTQPMKENRKKILSYEKMNAAHRKQFDADINLVFYTVSQIRKQKLEQFAKGKVPIQVYSVTDLR